MVNNIKKLLLIEDDDDYALLIKVMLKKAEKKGLFKLYRSTSLQEGLRTLMQSDFSVVLLDLGLPDSEGINTFDQIQQVKPDLAVVVLTGQDDENLGIIAVKKGAQDYLVKKSIDKRFLKRSIQYAYERKQMQLEKQKLQEQLYQSQKMDALGRLAGGVAHDFNNLLMTINGYCELIGYSLDEQHPVQSDLNEIRKAGDRATALTLQLRALSRKHVIRSIMVNLPQMMRDMEKMLRRTIGENIELQVQCDEKIESFKFGLGQMEQMIMNLAINARDAMPEGGQLLIKSEQVKFNQLSAFKKLKQPSLTPEDQDEKQDKVDEYVHLTVKDTGEGMDKDTRERIFEPFFTTKEIGKGTGLGMSIIYSIISQHKGLIHVESTLGEGTCFDLFLPIESELPTVLDDVDDSELMKNLIGNGEKILLVEDDNRVRKFIFRVLTENGYQVFEADNADSAIKMFNQKEGDFDLVFSDVVLPDKNGVEVIEYILEKNALMPVILTSGYSDERAMISVIEQKNIPFLHKPFSPTVLLQTIKNVITFG